jgi:hypothetical protein
VVLAEQTGLVLEAWQREALTASAARMLWNVARQLGKSTVAATLAAHTALYEPGSLTLCLSPTERQSGELLRKVRDVYRATGRPVPADSETKLALELETGSRVLALPGARDETVRGLSGPRLVLLDEAARISDELYYACSPMVATSGGRVILLSTPYGKRGVFHQLWTEGGAGWERVQVTAEESARIPADFLAQERATLPRHVYEREYLCRFHEVEDSAFAYDDVRAAIDPTVEPLAWDAA